MADTPRILIADGDPRFARSLAQRLAAWGHACASAHSVPDALDQLAQARPGFRVLLTDLGLPRGGGLELLARLKPAGIDTVPVVLTGFGKIATAVEAVKLGAADYLTKPAAEADLRRALNQAVLQHTLLGDPAPAGGLDGPGDPPAPGGMLGRDPLMQPVFTALRAAAAHDGPLLITGPPGSGKDLAARAVHAEGRARTRGPLVTRVAAQATAATWADDLRRAAGGTLILRGLDALPAPAASALLARLQARNPHAPASAPRLIATAPDPAALPRPPGALPRGLLDRLAVLRVALPPLRGRPDAIEQLAGHFLKRAAGRARRERSLTPAARRALIAHPWPGNVRELQNAIEHAVVTAAAAGITPEDLPAAITAASTPDPAPLSRSAAEPAAIPALAHGWTPTPLAQALVEPERQIVRAALEAHGWNRNAAARDLQIDRTTLYKKIKRFGLDRPAAG